MITIDKLIDDIVLISILEPFLGFCSRAPHLVCRIPETSDQGLLGDVWVIQYES